MGERYDWWDNIPSSVKYLLIGALLTGGAGNYMGLTKDTSDRYHATTAAKDHRELRLEFYKRFEEIERGRALHLEHSAQYTEVIKANRELLKHIDQELEEHLRDDH